VCGYTGRYAAAARYFQEAFAGRPELADDLMQHYRYQAACAAARAGGGQGEGAPADPDQRARWRRQAYDWLRAQLGLLSRRLQEGGPGAGDRVWPELVNWLRSPDLAGVRDAGRLAELPAEEQGEWRRLWDEVRALLTRGADGSAAR
jgi:hypothetical protein